MVKVGLTIVGTIAVLNGLAMWFAPLSWYQAIPGVADMGPFNMHFVRDIGLVYGFSGVAMIWGAVRGPTAVSVAGATWPALHAIFHISIWMGRGFSLDDVALVNLLGIQLPAWLGLWLAFKLLRQEKA